MRAFAVLAVLLLACGDEAAQLPPADLAPACLDGDGGNGFPGWCCVATDLGGQSWCLAHDLGTFTYGATTADSDRCCWPR